MVEPYVFGGVDLCDKFSVGILLDVSLVDDGSGGFEHSFQQRHLADVLQPLQHGGVNRIFGGVNAVQQCPAERNFIFRGLQQVDNVRNCCRFHPRCGTSFIFVMLIFSIIFSTILSKIFPAIAQIRVLWMFLKLAFIPLIMGVGYEFIKYAGRHDNLLVKILSAPGLWMQRLTTKEPSDDIIEVGIESLKAVITENPEDDEIK